jgi:hypothetical protein
MSAIGMRSAIIVLLVLTMSVPLSGMLGADSKDSLPGLEILPNTHQPIKLKGYDAAGDMLHITISPTVKEGKQIRSIDLYIMDERSANSFDMIKKLDPELQSMYYVHNISSRFEKDYKCLDDLQAYLVLYNPLRSINDDSDLFNSTAIFRVDYRVEDAAGGSSVPWGLIIMAFLALAIAGAVIVVIVIIRRAKVDKRSFFVKGSFMYYALQGPDGNIFYFGPDQYTRMYNAGSLAGFQFLGYTREIGGEIYNESGSIVSPTSAAPVEPAPAQPVTPIQVMVPEPQPVILQAPAPVMTQAEGAPQEAVTSEQPGPIPSPERSPIGASGSEQLPFQ